MRAKRMTLCALFAALTAVCAQIVIPVGAVPVSLALLPVLLCAALLPRRHAAAAMLVYLFLGLMGLPVFAQMTGGPGILFGVSGGYIFGYVLCAWLTAWLLEKSLPPWLAMGAGVLACYAVGTPWLMAMSHMGLIEALLAGVVPFIPGDAVKIALAIYLAKRLSPISR